MTTPEDALLRNMAEAARSDRMHQGTRDLAGYVLSLLDRLAAAEAAPVDVELRRADIGVERLMVVLRPWLGIHNDVELERACRRILAALRSPDTEETG